MARVPKGEAPDRELGNLHDERRWTTAVERQRALRPLLEAPGRSRADVEATARRLNVHPATIYRLLARYAAGRTAEAVVNSPGGWRKGRSRLSASVAEVVDAAIEKMFLDRQAPTRAQLGREIARRCAAAGLKAPSASAIARRVELINPRVALARREGSKAAERETMRPGSLQVASPNAVWQIDHSPADVILVDSASREPIGRPWVTFVIDVASRVVAGLHEDSATYVS